MVQRIEAIARGLLAHDIARFPQACVRADRRSTRDSYGLPLRDALIQEWETSRDVVAAEGIDGARRFASGAGRGGDFSDLGND